MFMGMGPGRPGGVFTWLGGTTPLWAIGSRRNGVRLRMSRGARGPWGGLRGVRGTGFWRDIGRLSVWCLGVMCAGEREVGGENGIRNVGEDGSGDEGEEEEVEEEEEG